MVYASCIEVYSCTVGIALIQGFSFVSDDALTNYSYVSVKAGVSEYITRCLSGLGPSGNGSNDVLGGLYFNGSEMLNGTVCSSQGIIQATPAPANAGIINMHKCEEFSTTAEGVYTYVMLNSSMMNESLSVGLYFTGRSESLDLRIYPIT